MSAKPCKYFYDDNDVTLIGVKKLFHVTIIVTQTAIMNITRLNQA